MRREAHERQEDGHARGKIAVQIRKDLPISPS